MYSVLAKTKSLLNTNVTWLGVVFLWTKQNFYSPKICLYGYIVLGLGVVLYIFLHVFDMPKQCNQTYCSECSGMLNKKKKGIAFHFYIMLSLK
jgi:hypothetical protein